MSNPSGTPASREEEIAFVLMEYVLNVDIRLADAGAGNSIPDGAWVYPGKSRRRGIVEVTSPPDAQVMARWARARRENEQLSESGDIPLRLGELAGYFQELLGQDWAQSNVRKLLARPAEERHLFLFARSYRIGGYFYRLSDTFDGGVREPVSALQLPAGISDVWFRGRARREPGSQTSQVSLARFNAVSGWRRYVVPIEEWQLPAPNPRIAADRVPANYRRPKGRNTLPTH